ncbi:hypothetical protein BYT27DRAFT_7259650 [Phlegmacium glaucopus]|nr:hypothetical protein BYT27DRAFT_7259650 [Phlegmacium glaucopus]
MDTPTPSGLNEQHIWGGNLFQESFPDDNKQITLVGQQAVGTSMQSSQAHIIASDSDNLFYPITSGHSSVPFILPNVPYRPVLNSNYTYNQLSPHFSYIPINRDHLSEPLITRPLHNLPFTSQYSSYNNPGFLVQPKQYKHPPSVHPPFFQPPLTTNPIPSFNPISIQLSHSATSQQQPYNSHILHPMINSLPNTLPSSGPIQYVYCIPPPTVPPPSLVPSIKTLPSVAHIPLLMNKFNFFAWDNAVTSLLWANGLIGHILDPSEIPDPSPDLSMLTCWWDNNNTAQHVLTSWIDAVPQGLLPSLNLVAWTALNIYQTLLCYYGTCNFADCAELLHSLSSVACIPGHIQEYVSKWRTGISCLQSTKFPFSIKLCISQFICGLPHVPAFNMLHADLSNRIAAAGDQDYGAFVIITENVLKLETIFHSVNHVPRSTRPLPANQTTLSPPQKITPNSIVPVPNAVPDWTPVPVQTCGNCGKTGHSVPTCFSPGGGMEGQRGAYKRDKGRFVVMLLVNLDNSYNLPEDTTLCEHESQPISPILDTLDDQLLLPSFANLTVSSVTASNENIHRDLYPMRDRSKIPSFAAVSSSDVPHLAFLSLGERFNSCLDSGCTDYIIRDWTLFHTYDTSGAVDIGTANCGSLSALASGDVTFCIPYKSHFAFFTLQGCLHAPEAPINLLSVGAMNERGIIITFHPNSPTTLLFPHNDPVLPNFSFSATVI